MSILVKSGQFTYSAVRPTKVPNRPCDQQRIGVFDETLSQCQAAKAQIEVLFYDSLGVYFTVAALCGAFIIFNDLVQNIVMKGSLFFSVPVQQIVQNVGILFSYDQVCNKGDDKNNKGGNDDGQSEATYLFINVFQRFCQVSSHLSERIIFKKGLYNVPVLYSV